MANSQRINRDTWKGNFLFRNFADMDMPYFSVTVPLDVTDITCFAKERQFSLFSVHLYSLARALNSRQGGEAFRYRIIEDGAVILHETIDTSYLILREDKNISALFAPQYDDFLQFHAQRKILEAAARLQAEPSFCTRPQNGLVYFSYTPWQNFSAIEPPCNIGARYDAIPRFTMGANEAHYDGRITLPFNIHAHHGFVDAYRVHTFIEAMQAEWQELMRAF